MRIDTLPEEAFLENNPTISPVDMTNCILIRTEALINCLQVSLEDTQYLTNETITAVLWQVSGNLEQIKKVTDKWHEADVRVCHKPGQVVPSIESST